MEVTRDTPEEREPGAAGTSVFLSYSRADRRQIEGLASLLEALGHEVFVDHKTIKPGERWEAKLQTGLIDAEVLIVFWTRHSARSDWVRRECEYFHGRFPDNGAALR